MYNSFHPKSHMSQDSERVFHSAGGQEARGKANAELYHFQERKRYVYSIALFCGIMIFMLSWLIRTPGDVFMRNFQWDPEDMEQVILWARDEDVSYYQAAKRWVQENPEQVKAWLEN